MEFKAQVHCSADEDFGECFVKLGVPLSKVHTAQTLPLALYQAHKLMNPILMYCDIFTLTGILCQVYNIKDFLYL